MILLVSSPHLLHIPPVARDEGKDFTPLLTMPNRARAFTPRIVKTIGGAADGAEAATVHPHIDFQGEPFPPLKSFYICINICIFHNIPRGGVSVE
jgi:hypothetical protein